MKRLKSLALTFALALAASALLVGHVPESLAQQEPGSRKPACGCYVCGKLVAVTFEDKDCAGILSESACGQRLANLPNKEREGFCQKIKAQVRFTSFKDSCPVYAPYCGPEKTAAQGPASGGPASPAQPGQSAGSTAGSKGTATQVATPSKSGKGDSIKPAEPPLVAGSPAPSTAAATPGKPATSNTPLAIPPSTTTQAAHPLKSLRVIPTPGATGGNRWQGTVELVQAPGPNGLTVTLESGNTQLAQLPPSVTITYGATSAETGPVFKATFPIDTHAVNEDTNVTIRARAGVQTLQAELRIRMPIIATAFLDAPDICDGNNKRTVKYKLSGPAPSGLKVIASVWLQYPSGYHGQTSSESETVPTGNSVGSMRIWIPPCFTQGYQRCTIQGHAKVEGQQAPASGLGGMCGHP